LTIAATAAAAMLPWASPQATGAIAVDQPAAAVAYDASVDSWSMAVIGGRVPSNGSSSMSLYGDWQQVQGNTGAAVQFNSATSYGIADGTGGRSPKKANFALGVVFRSNPIPAAYSGNVIQKGLWGDAGQIKIQVVPDGGGTVNCRVKGLKTAKFIGSSILVGDNVWHSALCWREGTTIGLTVDGVTTSKTVSVGSIANSRPLNVANKNDTATASDQLIGAIDCAVLATGPDARSAATAAMNC
jgi:hypothetical protein